MPGETDPSIEQLEAALAEARAQRVSEAHANARELVSETNLAPSRPAPQFTAPVKEFLASQAEPADPYSAARTAWSAGTEFDFTVPSGLTCRMQKVPLPKLASAGILDRVSRLPGLVQEVIDKSELKPPKPEDDENRMPTAEEIESLEAMLDLLIPLVVVIPKVYPAPPAGEAKIDGRIYVDSIDLADRVAIMEKSMEGVKGLDSFRK